MKIIKTITYIFALASTSLVAGTQTESPIKTPDAYTCEMVTKTSGMEIMSKMTAIGKKTRTETKMHGMESITIVDLESNMSLMLMPAAKSATKMKLDAGAAPNSKEKIVPTWEKVGSEGDLTVWNSTVEMNGQKVVTKYWLNAKGYQVKAETDAAGVKSTVEFKNLKEVKEGDIDVKLLSLDAPEGYTVQDMTK